MSPSSVASVKLAERYRASDRRHPYRNDVIAGLTLFTLSFLSDRALAQPQLNRGNLVIAIVGCVALALRRRFPISTLAVGTTLLTQVFFDSRDANIESILFWSALYTVGTLETPVRFGPRLLRQPDLGRNTSRALAASVLGVGFAVFVRRGGLVDASNPDSFVSNAFAILLAMFFVGSAWFTGDLVRTRRESDAELARQNVELTSQREENARRAVLDERVRIARELHDVVAHHVSLMGVQAGAARLALRQRPERAEAALSDIERSSRQAVSELQQLLGFLRQDESDSIAPQPTLDDLAALVADVERAGRPVRLTRTAEDTVNVAASVQLTTYRIVQEALTNAMKHSTTAPIEVSVSASDEQVNVSVRDHGHPLVPAPGKASVGHGLAGIRERVAFHGGQLLVQPMADGFTVEATLPNVIKQ